MPSVKSQEPFSELRKRLSKAGFPLPYVRKALPEWWDDSLWKTDSGFAQGAMILASSFGIGLKSLHKPNSKIKFETPTKTKFKHRSDTKKEDLAAAQSICYRAALTAAYCTKQEFTALPESAFKIRKDLIEKNKQDNVTLQNLLDYCWNIGIPVIHVSDFPSKAKRKPDGIAAIINDRPTIVLSKNMKFSAWQAFILAHEIGHLCLNHLSGDSVIVDDEVQVQDPERTEEKEANRFARELLLGQDINYTCQSRINAEQLAQNAQETGEKTKSDPGSIALNYAHTARFIPVGMKALGFLEPDADAIGTINQKMLGNIDPELLAEGPLRWLLSLTGAKA